MSLIRQAHAGVLVVLLLHGWPYDIDDYVEVAPLLAARGYRVIVPHLRARIHALFSTPPRPVRSARRNRRGCDPDRRVSRLRLGCRAACVVAALRPERCTGLVSVNDYLIQDFAHAGRRFRLNSNGASGLNSISRRRGSRGPGRQSKRYRPPAVDQCTHLALRRCDLPARRRFIRQSGLYRRGDPLVSASPWPGTRLAEICGCPGQASSPAGHHGAHRYARRGGECHHPCHR